MSRLSRPAHARRSESTSPRCISSLPPPPVRADRGRPLPSLPPARRRRVYHARLRVPESPFCEPYVPSQRARQATTGWQAGSSSRRRAARTLELPRLHALVSIHDPFEVDLAPSDRSSRGTTRPAGSHVRRPCMWSSSEARAHGHYRVACGPCLLISVFSVERLLYISSSISFVRFANLLTPWDRRSKIETIIA